MEHAKRFRALLAELGLSNLDAAKLLHLSLRTLQNWLSGRHEVPYASIKLLRLLRYTELPGRGWVGWHFSRGMLVTPEGAPSMALTALGGPCWCVRLGAFVRPISDQVNLSGLSWSLQRLARSAKGRPNWTP